MTDGKEGGSIEQVNNVLAQFHNAGIVDLDKSVREILAPARAVAQLGGGGEVSAAVIAWDGYGLIIASALGDPKELVNVARQLQQTTQRKV